MGTFNHEFAFAFYQDKSSWESARSELMRIKLMDEGEEKRRLWMEFPAANALMMPPDGSKEGWGDSQMGDQLREALIDGARKRKAHWGEVGLRCESKPEGLNKASSGRKKFDEQNCAQSFEELMRRARDAQALLTVVSGDGAGLGAPGARNYGSDENAKTIDWRSAKKNAPKGSWAGPSWGWSNGQATVAAAWVRGTQKGDAAEEKAQRAVLRAYALGAQRGEAGLWSAPDCCLLALNGKGKIEILLWPSAIGLSAAQMIAGLSAGEESALLAKEIKNQGQKAKSLKPRI